MNPKKIGKKLAAVVAAVVLFLLRPLHQYHQRALCFHVADLGEIDLDTVLRETKGVSEKVKNFIEKQERTIHEQSNKLDELKNRLTDLEQKGARRPWTGGIGGGERADIAELIVQAPQFDAFAKGATRECHIPIPGGLKTAIVNQSPATGQNLVMEQRVPGIIAPAQRRLFVRDLIPTIPTSSNLIFYPKESVFTNNAAIVFSSPNDRENVAKPESGITFTNGQAPVETIAHSIPASKQILDDVPQLRGYIDVRLIYGLKLAEEVEILTGDGSAGHLSGLMTNAVTYNRGVSNDTVIDTIRKAIVQCALSDYQASAVVLNPADFGERIELAKDTTGKYLMVAVRVGGRDQIWRIDVVESNSMTQGSFLVGAMDQAAAIYDRELANVTLGYVNDQFTKNMVTLLCEERIALAVFRPSAMVKGTLPATGT